MSLSHLSTLREKQGELTEAERLEREVLERRRRIYPAGHPEIAYALQSLGNTLQIQGGYPEADRSISRRWRSFASGSAPITPRPSSW